MEVELNDLPSSQLAVPIYRPSTRPTTTVTSGSVSVMSGETDTDSTSSLVKLKIVTEP